MNDDIRSKVPDAGRITRRQILAGTGALAVTVLVGCGDGEESVSDGGRLGGDAAADGDSRLSQDSGGARSDADGGANLPPVWQTIPDQNWMVGVPVLFDLAAYCQDPESDPLSFSLDMPLPPGLTLVGSVIRGVPTAEMETTPYVITADDAA